MSLAIFFKGHYRNNNKCENQNSANNKNSASHPVLSMGESLCEIQIRSNQSSQAIVGVGVIIFILLLGRQTQRSSLTCLKSQSWEAAELGYTPPLFRL